MGVRCTIEVPDDSLFLRRIDAKDTVHDSRLTRLPQAALHDLAAQVVVKILSILEPVGNRAVGLSDGDASIADTSVHQGLGSGVVCRYELAMRIGCLVPPHVDRLLSVPQDAEVMVGLGSNVHEDVHEIRLTENNRKQDGT